VALAQHPTEVHVSILRVSLLPSGYLLRNAMNRRQDEFAASMAEAAYLRYAPDENLQPRI
jgi:hypothetical protein